MNKIKVGTIFVVIIAIMLSYFEPIGGNNAIIDKHIKKLCVTKACVSNSFEDKTSLLDQLDQYQTNFCGYGWYCWEGSKLAQSFIPSLGTLTRIQLYMCKIGHPSSLTISIRSSLQGSDLVTVSISSSEVSTSFQWIEFNFPDIMVNPGQKYYIVWNPIGCDKNNNFAWGCGDNNPYTKGDAWYYDGKSWSILDNPSTSQPDFCFKTYGEKGMHGNYYALIIGISDYPGTDNDLLYPAKDALAIKNALLAGNNWHSNNIKFLTNEQATIKNVENALSWLISKETANDVSLIYFSGHGGQIDDKYPYDESDGKDEFLALYDFSQGGILLDDTMAVILNQFSGHVVVILDSCFSGGMPNPISKVKEEKFTKEFMEDISSPGRIILMSSKENEESVDVPAINHGLFSFYIISGSCGSADSNNEHTITAEETFYYAKPNVEYFCNLYLSHSQHPQIYDGILGQLPILNNILNKPPNKPNKPIGPTYGKRFRRYTYSTSTNDPNGDKIYYWFGWGDGSTTGWIGPYSSGQTVSASHWWYRGTYSIRVMAMDEYGAVSEWSEPLPISIPITPLNWFSEIIKFFQKMPMHQ